MAAMASLVNGERAVVVVFVARVVFSLPPSLFCHGLALSLLAVAALSLDARADDSISLPLFKTRPGASSGILLGAVTLPTVMLSKLIQMWRAVSFKEVEIEEFEHLMMQYWATSACCLGVLLLLCVLIWRAPGNMRSLGLHSGWHVKFSLICIGLYTALCCASLGTISLTGFNTMLKLLWMLCHGLAAVKLIQHLLNTFPSCASIGEGLLVTSGLVLYLGDMLALSIAKASRLLIAEGLVRYGSKRSEIGIIIQGMLLGLLLFPSVFKFVLQIWECFLSKEFSQSRTYNDTWRSVLFFSSLGFIMTVIVPTWMEFVLDFHMHPLLWVFSFVFSEPLKRLSLCIYWVVVICASVVRFYNISKNSKIERILLRKYYHLMAVSMFLPALIFQPKFLDLAFGAALGVFMALEIVRVWRIWPLGQPVHQFMTAFTDHRDSDILIVSHFSLLLGCALPIWMSSGYNDRPLVPFAGILSLGIGDTMASMVGHKYGVLRWSKTGKKTIEGTAAGITSVLATCSVLLPLLASTGYIVTEHWLSLVVAVTVSGLLEAYTTQLDNAFIPLVFYSLLSL
ncbi:phosphatidate cytidylyltransferase family protein [Parasponia andersonii]|uniref:dolichol kinase n=1 Tax=Parasponia andersonii TaxID=3476 RepID=A0A2P5CZN7_PARAD|nr:phosphatidate cytidylyltransferase family protein [Parasponia andersonii]